MNRRIVGLELAVLDIGGLGGGAAHVERDHARQLVGLRQMRRRDDAAGRAGFDRLGRTRGRILDPHGAAARVDDVEPPAKAVLGPQPPLQILVIGRHLRLHVSVDHRRARPLVFAELRIDLRRDRDERLRVELADDLRDPQLVLGVDEGEQEHHRDGVTPGRAQLLDGLADRSLVQRHQDVALGIDPLGHLEAQLARHQRHRLVVEQVVQAVPARALDFQHVAKPRRRDQPDARALLLGHHIGGDRRGVHQMLDVGEARVHLRQRLQARRDHAVGESRRRRGNLGEQELAGIVVPDGAVGESAPDIDADAQRPIGSESLVHECLQTPSMIAIVLYSHRCGSIMTSRAAANTSCTGALSQFAF